MNESENIRIRELKEENELLLLHLCQVQEELEGRYLGSTRDPEIDAARKTAGVAKGGRAPAVFERVPASLIARVREARGESSGTKDADEILRRMPEFLRLQNNLLRATRRIEIYESDLQRLTDEKESVEAASRDLTEQLEDTFREMEQAKAEWTSERQASNATHTDEVATLQVQVRELEQERNRLKAEHRDTVEEVPALQAQVRELEKEREKLEAGCRKMAEEVAAFQLHVNQSEKERERLEAGRLKVTDEAETPLEALERARSGWESERQLIEARKKTEIENLKAHYAAIEKERDLLQQERPQILKKIEILERSQKEKAEALEAARSDISVSVRLQTLREHDLKELQSRYGELLQKKEAQDELLTKLHDRLSVAADCLKQLEFANDDDLDADSAMRLARSLTGEPDRGE